MTRLVVGIDETGKFLQQKLSGRQRAGSGIAAVLTTLDERALSARLRALAAETDLEYPRQIHARELMNPRERTNMGCALSDEQARTALDTLQAGIDACIEDRFGLWGVLPGRHFFHEQQAYGEMLLALLALIQKRWAKRLRACKAVEIRVASRGSDELIGFTTPGEYARDLEEFLTGYCKRTGWPAMTAVMVRPAQKDPYLIAADLAAWAARKQPEWVEKASQVHLPSSHQAAVTALRRVDPASSIFLRLSRGEKVDGKKLFSRPTQSSYEALKRLADIAHAQVRDRHGQGSLDVALELVDWTWPWAQKAGATAIAGQLCTVAHEVISHQGKAADHPDSQRWAERAGGLDLGAWGTSTVTAQMARLEYRCQTVQTDRFNVFDFEGAYLEFADELERYEALAGGADQIAVGDVLYGKLLGTMGQACGFLRPVYPAIGDEAMAYLDRSAVHFETAEPLYRMMSLGFRVTDLWDRGELDAAESLLGSRPASELGPYDLLHRLRIAAARKARGQEREDHADHADVIARLRELMGSSDAAGNTPFDLCAKWALFLEPGDSLLRDLATRWMTSLDRERVALLATSLPLAATLGMWDLGRTNLERLETHSGFQTVWATERTEALRECLGVERELGYEALRAMPWNYA
jgi:hypothetical protein